MATTVTDPDMLWLLNQVESSAIREERAWSRLIKAGLSKSGSAALRELEQHMRSSPPVASWLDPRGGDLSCSAHVRTLPKPARIECGQRWILSDSWMREPVTVEKVDGSSVYCDVGCAHASSMLSSTDWLFLGYAKPSTVEVGQQWSVDRDRGAVVRVGHGWGYFEDGSSTNCHRMLEDDGWKFYGHVKREAPVPPTEPHVTIANSPPAWAEPTAWRCAVAAVHEHRADTAGFFGKNALGVDMTLALQDRTVPSDRWGALFAEVINDARAAYDRARFQPTKRQPQYVGRGRR